jgi:hypothetical protein
MLAASQPFNSLYFQNKIIKREKRKSNIENSVIIENIDIENNIFVLSKLFEKSKLY